MSDYLNGIIESEFDDEILAGLTEEELAGIIEAAPAKTKKKLVKKIQRQSKKAVASQPNNSRGELSRRMNQLPDAMQRGLASKALQAVDAAYYAIKPGGGVTSIKMLRDDDNKIVGLTNLSSGKLEKGNVLLLDRIVLLSGVSSMTAGSDVEKASEASFGVIEKELRNGQMELKANGQIILKDASLELFNTTSRNNIQIGCFKLDNPKMIYDQQAVELNLEFGKALPANTWVKVILMGTQVVRN